MTQPESDSDGDENKTREINVPSTTKKQKALYLIFIRRYLLLTLHLLHLQRGKEEDQLRFYRLMMIQMIQQVQERGRNHHCLLFELILQAK